MSQQLKRHVYVVDDEHVIAHTLAAILKNAGLDATAYTSPRDALESAAQHQPDLLISDVMLPEMTGVELGIYFRTRYPQCNVLLFSGQATTGSLLEAAREQGHDFTLLTKPIHPTDLLAAIGKL
jgi:CheY-like chemotaxis protein